MKTPLQAIVILGSPNDPEGRLSSIALGRLEAGLEEFRAQPGSRILLTGGYGAHFNTSPRPHAAWAGDWLLERGVPEDAFLDAALSANTVEDAVLAKAIFLREGIGRALIVSSDYHIERVKHVFSRLCPGIDLAFLPAPSGLSADEVEPLRRHERMALGLLVEKGIWHEGARIG